MTNDCKHEIPSELFWDRESAELLGFAIGAITFCKHCKSIFLAWYLEDGKIALKYLSDDEKAHLVLLGYDPLKPNIFPLPFNLEAAKKFMADMRSFYDSKDND